MQILPLRCVTLAKSLLLPGPLFLPWKWTDSESTFYELLSRHGFSYYQNLGFLLTVTSRQCYEVKAGQAWESDGRGFKC